MKTASNSLRQRLMQLNDATAQAIRGHLECAVNNFIANGRWRFIDGNGPKIQRVAEKEPIMWKLVSCCWSYCTPCCISRSQGEMYSGHGRLCVCLSLAAFPRYCMDLNVT